MGLFSKNNKNDNEPEDMGKKLEEAKKFLLDTKFKDTTLMSYSIEAREVAAATYILHNDLEEIKSLLRDLQK